MHAARVAWLTVSMITVPSRLRRSFDNSIFLSFWLHNIHIHGFMVQEGGPHAMILSYPINSIDSISIIISIDIDNSYHTLFFHFFKKAVFPEFLRKAWWGAAWTEQSGDDMMGGIRIRISISNISYLRYPMYNFINMYNVTYAIYFNIVSGAAVW